jgi:hypothetical protein
MTQGVAQQESVYDRQLNRLESYAEDTGRLVRYEPHDYSFAFPLHPGKEWGGTVKWNALPYGGEFDVKATVKGWEKTSLEIRDGAGSRAEEVDVLRIEYEHVDRGRTTRSTCWYAPAVRFAVRCESSLPAFAYEVIGYAKPEPATPEHGAAE